MSNSLPIHGTSFFLQLSTILFHFLHNTMATVVNFSGKTTSRRICLKPMAEPGPGPAIGSLAIKRTCQFPLSRTNTLQHCIYMTRKAQDRLLNEHKVFPALAATRNLDIFPGSPSPSDTIKQFYRCINEKNLKQLRDHISEDCYIEECSFHTPLQGKKVNTLCSSS